MTLKIDRMDSPTILRTGQPGEVRGFELGRLELYEIGGMQLGRATYEPRWRWSEHVRPMAGTVPREVSHVGLVPSGCAAVRMTDGMELVIGVGGCFPIAADHDSWVIGDEPYVSLHLMGADTYAAPSALTDGAPDLEAASEPMRLIGLRGVTTPGVCVHGDDGA